MRSIVFFLSILLFIVLAVNSDSFFENFDSAKVKIIQDIVQSNELSKNTISCTCQQNNNGDALKKKSRRVRIKAKKDKIKTENLMPGEGYL